MVKRKIALVLMLVVVLAAPAAADNLEAEIAHLIQYVRESKATFFRNGQGYQSDEALTHVARKRDYFKNKIKTAEDFIRLCATKSEISGKPYTLKCPDGQVRETGGWLMEELSRYRKK